MVLSGQHSNNYDKLLTQRRRILDEILDGDTISESRCLVKRINEHGETEVHRITSPQKRLTPSEIREVADAFKAGKTTYELAKQYGCHRGAIRNALKSVGITLKSGRPQIEVDEAKVISLYEDHHTMAEIAKQLGVDVHIISRCLKRNNVTMRCRGDYFNR